jgi:hypothetical protein
MERTTFLWGLVSFTWTNCFILFLNWISNGQSCQYVLVYNFTSMNTTSHKLYFCVACSSNFNISEPTFHLIITSHLTVSQLELCSCWIPTNISDSQSVNISLLEVIQSSNNQGVFVRNLSDLDLYILFNTPWASITVGLMSSNVWNISWHPDLSRFYLHCGMEETGRPGIIYVIGYWVFCHLSEYEIGSIVKQIPAIVCIAFWN